MYCKYCGSPLKNNSGRCGECGSKIDIYDGGQSFFTDEEINEWDSFDYKKEDSAVPTTEILGEPLDDDYINDWKIKKIDELDFDIDDYKTKKSVHKNLKGGFLGKRNYHRKSRKNKNKRIIMFFGGAVIIMIILLISIIFILSSPTNKEETDSNDEAVNFVEGMSETSGGESITQQNTSNQKGNEEKKSKEDKSQEKNKKIIKNINELDKNEYKLKVLEDNNFLSGQNSKIHYNEYKGNVGPIISINDVVYIPFDWFMRNSGYKYNKEKSGSEDGTVWFDSEDSDSRIILKKGTKEVRYKFKEDKEEKTVELDQCIYNYDSKGNPTYIPVKSFFEKIGMGEYFRFDNDRNPVLEREMKK